MRNIHFLNLESWKHSIVSQTNESFLSPFILPYFVIFFLFLTRDDTKIVYSLQLTFLLQTLPLCFLKHSAESSSAINSVFGYSDEFTLVRKFYKLATNTHPQMSRILKSSALFWLCLKCHTIPKIKWERYAYFLPFLENILPNSSTS